MSSESKKKLDFILNPDKREYKHVGLAIGLTVLFFIIAIITAVFNVFLSIVSGLLIVLIWFFALENGRRPKADGDVYEVVTKKKPDGTIKEEELVKIDFKTYLSPSSNPHKGNTNCLITGTAGMGKTELACYLMTVVKDPKIVFSFKGQRFFGCGIPILDVSVAIPSDLFANPSDFIGAYKVAFPVSEKMTGITVVAAGGVLKEALHGCRSWDQLFKNLSRNTGSNIQREARIHVITQLKSLSFPASQSSSDDLNSAEGMVFDFSKLEYEDAKSFYAEILLRMLWRKIRKEQMSRVALVIDEVHHILKGARAEATIFTEVLREIREYGSAWAITQNYSDIEDEIRNQFDTQLCFRTTSEHDLKAMGQISAALSLKAKAMSRYRFVDAKFPLQWYYPAWVADVSKLTTQHPVFVEPHRKHIDYEKEVLDRLPDYPSSMARKISNDQEIEIDLAKKTVAKAIEKLRTNGIVDYGEYTNARGDTVKVYDKKNSLKSAFREYVFADAIKTLTEAGFELTQEPENMEKQNLIDLGFCTIQLALDSNDIAKINETTETQTGKPYFILLPNEVEKKKLAPSPFLHHFVLMPELMSVIKTLKEGIEHRSK